MAEVVTTETINPIIAPFTVSARRENTNIPWGVCSHVAAFTAPQVAAGDTGKAVINLLVPQNYWFQLAGFHIDMSSTSAPNWDDGVFRSFYTGFNSLNPDFTQQEIFFPLAVTSEASIGTTQYKNVGVAAGGAQSAYDVNSPVNFIQTSSEWIGLWESFYNNWKKMVFWKKPSLYGIPITVGPYPDKKDCCMTRD